MIIQLFLQFQESIKICKLSLQIIQVKIIESQLKKNFCSLVVYKDELIYKTERDW